MLKVSMLNKREKLLIELLAQGYDRKEIARQVLASKRIVGHMIENLCNRADIPTKAAALTAWYYKNAQKNEEIEKH